MPRESSRRGRRRGGRGTSDEPSSRFARDRGTGELGEEEEHGEGEDGEFGGHRGWSLRGSQGEVGERAVEAAAGARCDAAPRAGAWR